MDFIKKNKYTMIAIFCFLLLVILLVQVKNTFFPNMGKAIYGNRLEGIENAKISDKELTTLKDALKKNDTINKVSTIVSGKLVNVIITVGDDLGLEQAKKLAGEIYKEFTTEQQKFYDFQVFIQKTSDASDFPIIGYKHHNREGFSWTRDRTVA